MEVQVVPSGEVWIWNALPYAVSQFSVTWQIDWVEPRSTSSHCGSENALDQRVPRLPSTAAEAGKPAFSSEDAVAGLFSATSALPQVPPPVPKTPNSHRLYPYWVARAVPYMRMYLPEPVTLRVCVPPDRKSTRLNS